jgi:lysophospholipase L1-like esterase
MINSKKRPIIRIIVIGVCALILIGVFILRKNFPYDLEVVPTDKGIWVINTTEWADRDCFIVAASDKGQRVTAILPAKINLVKIDGLTNGTSYELNIRRQDILGRLKYKDAVIKATPRSDNKKYIVLVGASVGKSWNLSELSERMNDKKVCYGYRGIYAFDKTAVLQKLIKSQLKPDAVIIKECASYFPRESGASINAIKEWVQVLQDAGIQPILATVVPVTEAHDKERKSPLMASINEFNEAIRTLCSEKGILLLDLQKALSNNKIERYLDDNYAIEDGLHLKEKTYSSVLDKFLEDFIHVNVLKSDS